MTRPADRPTTMPDLPLSPDTDPAREPLPGDFLALQHVQPFVLDDGASRSLHFTHGELQSRLLTSAPWRLDVDYTRTMMGFLLFGSAPEHIGMIGLGGGSLARFCHRHLRASRMTVLEINPHVIALRREFQVPDDDERFTVLAADGARYLATQEPAFDVLLVDGFDHQGQPAALCSQAFYDDCLAALAPGGLLVVNLHYDHPDYSLLVERIGRSFDGNVVDVLSSEKSNGIVFAGQGAPLLSRRLSVSSSLAGLDKEACLELRAELTHLVWKLGALAHGQ